MSQTESKLVHDIIEHIFQLFVLLCPLIKLFAFLSLRLIFVHFYYLLLQMCLILLQLFNGHFINIRLFSGSYFDRKLKVFIF